MHVLPKCLTATGRLQRSFRDYVAVL